MTPICVQWQKSVFCFILLSLNQASQLDSLIRCCYSSWLSLVTFKINLLKVVEFCQSRQFYDTDPIRYIFFVSIFGRLYLINSPVVRGDTLKFQEKGVKDIIKDVFLPWYNAHRFLLQNIQQLERVRLTDNCLSIILFWAGYCRCNLHETNVLNK